MTKRALTVFAKLLLCFLFVVFVLIISPFLLMTGVPRHG